MNNQDFIYVIATPNYFDSSIIYTTIIDLNYAPIGKDKMYGYLNHNRLYPNVSLNRNFERYCCDLTKTSAQLQAMYKKWDEEMRSEGEKKINDCKRYFKSRLTSCSEEDISRVAMMISNDFKNVQIKQK